MGWFKTGAKNTGNAVDATKGALKNLDGGNINASVKAGTKDAKGDIPLKGKDSGLEAPNTKPKDTGVEAPKPKSTAENAKDLAKNVAVGGGIGALGAFLPGLINAGKDIGQTALLADTGKKMFDALLNSPEGLTAIVAGVAIVAYISIRR